MQHLMKPRSYTLSKLFLDKKYLSFSISNASLLPAAIKLASLGFLVSVATACTHTTSSLNLSIEVKPSNHRGTYLVTGTTNLPDQSHISVAGIRSLQTNAGVQTLSGVEEANDLILARQTVEVTQGKWQTILNLWQRTPDGRYQEAWQPKQTRLALPAAPAKKVSFVAVFDPNNQLPAVTQQVGQKSLAAHAPLLRFTEAGEQYLQAQKDLVVSWPTGNSSLSLATPMEQGDQKTVRLSPNPELTKRLRTTATKQSQTTLPLSSSEFLR